MIKESGIPKPSINLHKKHVLIGDRLANKSDKAYLRMDVNLCLPSTQLVVSEPSSNESTTNIGGGM